MFNPILLLGNLIMAPLAYLIGRRWIMRLMAAGIMLPTLAMSGFMTYAGLRAGGSVVNLPPIAGVVMTWLVIAGITIAAALPGLYLGLYLRHRAPWRKAK